MRTASRLRPHVSGIAEPRRGVRPGFTLRGAPAQDGATPAGSNDPAALMVVGPIRPRIRLLEVHNGIGVVRTDELLVDGHGALLRKSRARSAVHSTMAVAPN